MGWRKTLMGALVVGAVGFTAGRVFSQDAKTPTKEEMEKAWAEMSAPTEEHKKLAANAGTWDCEMTMFEPGQEPKKEKGVTTSKSVLNGLYMASEHKSTMGGKPFEGFGFDGYSKEKKKYFTFWADQMGTTPMLLWGTEEGKTITYDGDVYDCGVMGMMTPRIKITHDDADHFTFEFWAKMGNAPDYAKMMEGKYTRRK
jgi:Protein of unknown function (DUF1579)